MRQMVAQLMEIPYLGETTAETSPMLEMVALGQMTVLDQTTVMEAKTPTTVVVGWVSLQIQLLQEIPFR